MPDGSVPLLIAIIILVFLSGFFSSTETAYSCASRIKLRALAGSGNKRAAQTLNLAEKNYDKFISTILIGNNIVNLTATTLCTLFFAMIIQGNVSAPVVSTIVITLAILIFGEITPKFIAKTYPEKLAMSYYPIIICFYFILYPLNLIASGWKWLISKIFRLKSTDIVTEEEIMTVVEEAEEDGTLRKDETKLIRSVIEFDDLEVGDILVPRVNVVAIEATWSMEKIRRLFDEEGYSRLPVYSGTIDRIIGSIHEKDFFNAYLAHKTSINDILQKAFFTSEHTKISRLLKQLQKKKVHIAVVLDEYGGTLGIVTLEDILEELVGDIWDEHDEEVNYFKKIDENCYLVNGDAPLDDMFDFFNLSKEDDKFDANTASGWVIEKLGEIPHAGRKFDYLNLTVEVTKSTVKRVLQIKITVNPTEEKDKD